MRKAAVYTLFLTFLALQYGHMLSYLYCKWQAELVLHQSDCGCEDQLAAAFVTQPQSDTIIPPQATTQVIDLFQEPVTEVPSFQGAQRMLPGIRYASSLAEGFQRPPFHPPAC